MTDTRADRIDLEGYTPGHDEDLAFMSNMVGPEYFRTLRIPLVAGREFEDRDDLHGAPVAIVNTTLAERYWGGPDRAIGKRLRTVDGRWRTVVGVAADAKLNQADGLHPTADGVEAIVRNILPTVESFLKERVAVRTAR